MKALREAMEETPTSNLAHNRPPRPAPTLPAYIIRDTRPDRRVRASALQIRTQSPKRPSKTESSRPPELWQSQHVVVVNSHTLNLTKPSRRRDLVG